MEKLYDRIDWNNNTTPALNETNLNAMSKAIDDIDDRVIDIADDVLVVVPEILDKYADIEALTTNPPYIGQNGHWWTWDTDTNQYVDSGVDAGVSVTVGTTTTLPAGSSATVTNSGTDTDPVLNFGIPQGATGQNGADGVGVPSGGTTGQVLKKVSGTDYDTEWANESGGGSGGHTIINSAGTSMTQRDGLQFEGMGVTDDSVNDKTVVTLPTPDYVDAQYNSSTTYSKGMTCISGNVRYRYKNSTASSGHQPPDATYWEVFSVAKQLKPTDVILADSGWISKSDFGSWETSYSRYSKQIDQVPLTTSILSEYTGLGKLYLRIYSDASDDSASISMASLMYFDSNHITTANYISGGCAWLVGLMMGTLVDLNNNHWYLFVSSPSQTLCDTFFASTRKLRFQIVGIK